MVDRLGLPGTVAALVAVGALCAAVFQKSTLALIVAIPAAIYVAVRIVRPVGRALEQQGPNVGDQRSQRDGRASVLASSHRLFSPPADQTRVVFE